MLPKIDAKIIDGCNIITHYLQSRGIIPLNTVIMIIEILFWTICIGVNATSFMIWLMAPFAAITLYSAHLKWQRDNGYWENPRKTLKLNAEVTLNRDRVVPRIITASVALFFFIIGFLNKDIWLIIGPGTFFPMLYVQCCWYIGPGEYAKQRKENLFGLTDIG